MGLNTSYNCWSGSYSSFSGWRNAIAWAAGYELRANKYGLECPEPAFADEYTPYNYLGYWDTTPDDILLVLLVHADHQGRIEARHTKDLADRLQGLLPKLEYHQGLKQKTEQFIEGLRKAYDDYEHVEFF